MTPAILLVLALVVVNAGPVLSQEIRITEPPDGAEVGHRPTLHGTVANPQANVVVVVHPMGVNEYWVQPEVNVRENGNWSVAPYIGRPQMDCGKEFEVMAIANPEEHLEEGEALEEFPRGESRSPVRLFVRAKEC